MALYPYTQAKQIENHVQQFMRAVSGFQYATGKRLDNGRLETARIPVVYGAMDRIVAQHLNKRDNFTNGKLPIISVNLNGIERDVQHKKSSYHIDTVTSGDDVVERLVGPPLVLNIDLSIYASSNHELFLVLEQFLLVFSDRVAIQTTSNINDPTYITEILLDSLQPEIQSMPIGTNRRVVQFGLNFRVPMRMRYPFSSNQNFIETIRKNVFEESNEGISTEGILEEIIGDNQ